MREVAELVDHFKAQRETRELNELKEARQTRDMLQKAGIPT